MTPRTARPFAARSRARSSPWSTPGVGLLAAVVVCLAGCDIDGTLKADGSGKVEMTYLTQPNTTEVLERRRFTSDHVTVDSIKLNADRTATVRAGFDDVTRLSTAEGFKTVSVTRTREGGNERLTVKVTNKLHGAVKEDSSKPGTKISLALPGNVLEANRAATIAENRVTWSFTFAEWLKDEIVELTVRYAAPPADQAGAAEQPADKPATK